ncbi:nitrilase-related carbon-nitrogen hydrolase [Geoglobus acetivorans]|uniref:Nitrilase/cyanide hydratase and apolipoprotein N-acyltransferase n=1 Tax=Geoglobus acetivorans TaxID=565033 RepID=A0A0A7GH56_GEOAI|nr:nitrilase/cyanide hydratase and apolipoprotein N-acyltransferase [Geoglobus acetivorans]
MELTAACGQQRIIRDIRTNKSKGLSLIKRAVQVNARIIVLPEASNTGLFPENYEGVKTAEEELDTVLKLSEKKDILIIAGVVERENGKLYNSVCLIHRGEITGKYRKILPFPLTHEKDHFTPGKELKVFETPFGKIGILVCYEIRFPELARKLAKMGAEIIAVPAEFPSARIEHWKTLIRARAIENQVYVLAANSVDFEKNYNGHSAIIDPYGRVLNEAGELQELIFAKIDLEDVENCRKQYPFLNDLKKVEKIV